MIVSAIMQYYAGDKKNKLAKNVKMEEVEISLYSLFVGQGYPRTKKLGCPGRLPGFEVIFLT